jgi:hypothetical protein
MYVWLQLTTHNKFDWLNSTPWTAMATAHEFVCAGTWIDPFEMQCIYLFILTSVILKTNVFTGIKTVHFGLCQWKYRNPNGRKPNTNQNCSHLTYVTYINQKIFTFRVKIQWKSLYDSWCGHFVYGDVLWHGFSAKQIDVRAEEIEHKTSWEKSLCQSESNCILVLSLEKKSTLYTTLVLSPFSGCETCAVSVQMYNRIDANWLPELMRTCFGQRVLFGVARQNTNSHVAAKNKAVHRGFIGNQDTWRIFVEPPPPHPPDLPSSFHCLPRPLVASFAASLRTEPFYWIDGGDQRFSRRWEHRADHITAAMLTQVVCPVIRLLIIVLRGRRNHRSPVGHWLFWFCNWKPQIPNSSSDVNLCIKC